MGEQVRWGLIGPGAIAGNFALGLAAAPSGRLVAVAGRSPERAADFAEQHGLPREAATDIDGLLGDSGIDAVHIAAPHPAHAPLALRVIRAGKAVSVEKPLGLDAAEATAVVEAAEQEGVFLMEALMWLCHPQVARAVEIVRAGEIGEVRHVRAAFGFSAARNAASRLYDRELAGGGILDVGPYPVSAARLFAGATSGEFADPVTLKGHGLIGPTGVDEVAYGLLGFENGVTAEIACAVARAMENTVRVEGTEGTLILPNPWVPGRNAGPSDATLVIETAAGRREETLRSADILFAHEAEAASRAILAGEKGLTFPAMPPRASVGNAATLDRWRREVGYTTFAETPPTVRRLTGTLPKGLPPVPKIEMPGLPRPMSRLVLGCDNRETLNEGAVIWDAWMEAGGNAFDTAFVYGAGRHEAVLGQWIESRGVADEILVIGKGAHSPYCLPDAIAPQLAMSLGRLGLPGVPIYILHRDNPAVPVGEFVEAIAELRAQGLVGLWGGSNWSPARFAEAVDWAEANGHEPPRFLNNNLSLAVMERPVWPGCVTSNDAETLAFLEERQVAHLSWSSQARGYFLPAALRDRLPEDTRPETCFGSEANAERRGRAEMVAAEAGVSAHNVALAWVLAQPFPSFALIGPRSPGELGSTLPALQVELTPEKRDWLNLR